MADEVMDTTVLVVDDEPAVADAYTAQLEAEYDVRTAYGGEEALELVDEAVDIVLLDRRMPTLPGDEVLDRVSTMDIDCRVVMVTAVEPDFDIVDMPFEDYLQKPVDRTALVETIERQLSVRQYDDRLEEYLELSRKLGLLEEQKQPTELDESKDVQQLQNRVAALKGELDETVMQYDTAARAFTDLV